MSIYMWYEYKKQITKYLLYNIVLSNIHVDQFQECNFTRNLGTICPQILHKIIKMSRRKDFKTSVI